MATTSTLAETKFPATMISEMFEKASGHSALAKLSAAKPLAFNGNEVMTFSQQQNQQQLNLQALQ